MKILVVDDTPVKIQKIELVIKEVITAEPLEVLVAENVADAMLYFTDGHQVDLMILDLNLPNRKGEEVKKLAGLRLIKEINLRNDLHKPESILGLTAYAKEKLECGSYFEKEGWAIIHFSLKETEWEYAVKNKILYLLNKARRVNATPRNKILFLAASPSDAGQLNAGLEQRKIEEMLQNATFRDELELISKTGVKLDTVTRELMQHNPQFVHFTGHGSFQGLALEEDNGTATLIPAIALENLFKLFTGTIRCVFLSACYSSEHARSISKHNMYVIGMNNPVGVTAATEFAKGFYQALAEGKDIVTSFEFGKIHLMANDIDQANVPEIWYNSQLVNE